MPTSTLGDGNVLSLKESRGGGKNPTERVREGGRVLPLLPSWLGQLRILPTPVPLPGKSMDRGARQATVHDVAKSQT